MAVDVRVVREHTHHSLADTAVQQGAGYVGGDPRCSSIDRSADEGLSTKSNLAGSLVPDNADVGVKGEVLLCTGIDGVDDALAVRERSVGGLWQ